MKKPRCAISRCLLGDNVRYDGKHKANDIVNRELSLYFEWFPICPEVEIGMPVPRPPMHLIKQQAQIHAVHIHDEQNDFTEALRRHAHHLRKQLANVAGYIVKSRSPSCGLHSVPIAGEARLGSGVFIETVEALFPRLPIIDEEGLTDEAQRSQFFEAVLCFQAANGGNRI